MTPPPEPEQNRWLWPAATAVTYGDRYTRTDAFVRWGMAVAYARYKFVTVSSPKQFRNARLTSETATWIQKYF